MKLNVLMIVWVALTSVTLQADDKDDSASKRLSNQQSAVSGRFARFERVLTQMADMLGFEDPERAELLRRAISEGRENEIRATLDAIASDLDGANFGDASEKQKRVTSDLEGLLKLLQSEDRRSSVEKERERLNKLLKGVRDTINAQRAARARTQNTRSPAEASPDQQRANSKADKLLDDVQKHDARQKEQDGESGQEGDSSSQSSENRSGEDDSNSESSSNQKGQDGENGEQSKSDSPMKGDSESSSDQGSENGESKNDESKDGESQSGESQNGESSEKSKDSSGDEKESQANQTPESKPDKDSRDNQQGDSADGQSSQSDSQQSDQQQQKSGQQQSQSQDQQSGQQQQSESQDQQQTPGRQQLQDARNVMREALDQLKQQKKDEAVDKQDEAIAKLQQTAEEIEKLLKQLREEEKEMILATLEARFQRLLAIQTQVYESTLDLAATPRGEWLNNMVSECRELANQQADLFKECSFTTSLLREDGTSVAILVAVEDIERDMGAIADRLLKTKVGTLTQSIETDCIEALKELIEVTQREMQEMKEQQQQQQAQQQQPGQQNEPLVQLMQEIKVLRSLQVRVNRRVERVNQLMGEASPDDASDLQGQLEELAARQWRLRDSAMELAKQLEKARQ